MYGTYSYILTDFHQNFTQILTAWIRSYVELYPNLNRSQEHLAFLTCIRLHKTAVEDKNNKYSYSYILTDLQQICHICF